MPEPPEVEVDVEVLRKRVVARPLDRSRFAGRFHGGPRLKRVAGRTWLAT